VKIPISHTHPLFIKPLVVNTNMNSLLIENMLANAQTQVSSSLQKLSSGLRINSAQNDPAGFAIANSFKAGISAMQVARLTERQPGAVDAPDGGRSIQPDQRHPCTDEISGYRGCVGSGVLYQSRLFA
jgi:hypothetical protein